MIELIGVTKVYGDKKALDNLSLTIKDGEIFGFLGHNGAGKSTTIKSLVSIIEPTNGEIFFDGKNMKEDRLGIKKKIAYVPDSPDMFLQLTANEYWDLISAAYELKGQEQRRQELIELFDLVGLTRTKRWKASLMGCGRKRSSSGRCCLIRIFGSWMSRCRAWTRRPLLI